MDEQKIAEALQRGIATYKKRAILIQSIFFALTILLAVLPIAVIASWFLGKVSLTGGQVTSISVILVPLLVFSYKRYESLLACLFECEMLEVHFVSGGVRHLVKKIETISCVRITSSLADFAVKREK